YPCLYQRQTSHQLQPNQATYQTRHTFQPPTYPQSTLFPYTTLFRSRASASAPGGLRGGGTGRSRRGAAARPPRTRPLPTRRCRRSEEHTSELQSRGQLVCRLLLEKKNSFIIGRLATKFKKIKQLIRN